MEYLSQKRQKEFFALFTLNQYTYRLEYLILKLFGCEKNCIKQVNSHMKFNIAIG